MILCQKFANSIKAIENESNETDLLNEVGQKRKRVDFENQYFMKDLIVITDMEPCYMCAMGLVHSRISRLYY